jgi:fermentation-respiration switch protein FrsA (DUF1100 family)
MLRALLPALGLIAAALILVIALAYFGQESLMFFPDRTLRATPALVGLQFEEVWLKAEDGIGLGAWWVEPEQARGAVVFAHGNAGNISDRLDAIRLFADLGLAVLAFDYRGYGASDGSPSEQGTYRDMEAAVAHLRSARGFGPERTVYYGESLGGAVALATAIKLPPAALVLESTFTSVRAMAAVHYPFVPGVLATRVRYDSLARVRQVRCPLLVLHGPADTIVPYRMGRELFDAAPAPKAFADLEGDHNDGGLVVSPAVQAALRSFLDAHLPPRAESRQE